MIFTFMEYAPSQYVTYLYTGTAADSVMDADARNLFLDCADRYYADSSLSDAEFFEKVFVKPLIRLWRTRRAMREPQYYTPCAERPSCLSWRQADSFQNTGEKGS